MKIRRINYFKINEIFISLGENWDFLSKSPEYSNDRKKSAIELAQPIMFSYNAFHLFESKTEVKISGSKWSKVKFLSIFLYLLYSLLPIIFKSCRVLV